MLAELHGLDGRTTQTEFTTVRGSDRSDRSSDAGSERGSDDSWRLNEEWGTSCHQTRTDDMSLQPIKVNTEPPLRAPMLVPITDNTRRRLNRNFNRNYRPDDRQLCRDNRSRQYGSCGSPCHTANSARGAANCANKCTMLASANPSKKSPTSSTPRWRRTWVLNSSRYSTTTILIRQPSN
ncbi:unnamed protein product [Phytophthora fragariaefolia]|uniref:Unnamed protein product n=1 Tax=Phytophthora fragariaefolia TaxID=1490495 RepID=A0A9W6Y1M2_9STRA|nr:unnamed protein product [Phytophthora fragariaefolia]